MTNHLESALRKLGNPVFGVETDEEGVVRQVSPHGSYHHWRKPKVNATPEFFEGSPPRLSSMHLHPDNVLVLDIPADFGGAWIEVGFKPEFADIRAWLGRIVGGARANSLSVDEVCACFRLSESDSGSGRWNVNFAFDVKAVTPNI